MTKTLVAYFSASGTTGRVAANLASAIGADLYEIISEVPYSSADLNWNNKGSRSSLEMNDDVARPALAGDVPNTSAYDVVFVGFPIWWYVEPRVVDTFLESADLAGKTVVPFATSGGSGVGRAVSRIRSIASGANVVEGDLLNGRPSQAKLATWAKGVLR